VARDDLDLDDIIVFLARHHFAVLSPEMADLFVSIERRIAAGIDVPMCEFESVLCACYSSAFGDFHRALVVA
jgi:hypothetical protein